MDNADNETAIPNLARQCLADIEAAEIQQPDRDPAQIIEMYLQRAVNAVRAQVP